VTALRELIISLSSTSIVKVAVATLVFGHRSHHPNSVQNLEARDSVLECGGKALRDTALDTEGAFEMGLRVAG